jgi:hypothetical protein
MRKKGFFARHTSSSISFKISSQTSKAELQQILMDAPVTRENFESSRLSGDVCVWPRAF